MCIALGTLFGVGGVVQSLAGTEVGTAVGTGVVLVSTALLIYCARQVVEKFDPVPESSQA